MRKLLASILVGSVLLSFTQNAQAQVEGITRQNSIGVHLQPSNTSLVYTGGYGIKGIPITVGPRIQTNYQFDYKFLSSFVGATANYHYGQHLKVNHEKIDLYAGATLGMGLYASFYDEVDFATNTQMYLQTGGRYFITPGIGLYGQVNLGVNRIASLVNGTSFEFGITFRRK
ncbi:hypothetical protein [Emticicia fontis]